MGSRRTTPTAPVAAAVVSEAMMEPTNTPCVQSRDWYTRGAVLARRPPKTMAEMGTPRGLSNSGEMQGQFLAGAVKRADEIIAATPGAVLAGQFDNPANPAAHERTTGPELWSDLGGKLAAVVAGVGTGGTISGVARVLKDKNPNVRIVAVQPAESPLLTGGAPGPHGIQGLMPNFVPDTFDADLIDEVVSVETATALEFARRAAAEEGLLVGISSGAALAGTAVVAARPELAGKKFVTLLPDTGERYLSTALFAGLED